MSALAPTVKTTTETARTDEFGVTSSRFGDPIPIVFGTQRLPGNVIWANNIREERTSDVQSSGGKGAPKQETTTVTYSYFVDLAVAFSEGPASSIRRIWGDGKLIYDATGSGVVETEGLTFRLYKGTEDQIPDPTIEASITETVGPNSTPAYRGLVYAVFEDFPLANFGNRIPSITAEIAFTEQELVVTVETVADTVHDNIGESLSVDANNEIMYWEDADTNIRSSPISAAGFLPTLYTSSSAPAGGLRGVSDAGDVIWTPAEDSNIADDLNIGGVNYDDNSLVQDRRLARVPGYPTTIFYHSSANSRSSQRLSLADYSAWNSSNNGQPQLAEVATSGLVDLGYVVAGSNGRAWAVCRTSGGLKVYLARPTGSSWEIVSPDPITASDLGLPGSITGDVWAAYDPRNERLLISTVINGENRIIALKEGGVVLNVLFFEIDTYFSVVWVSDPLPFRPTKVIKCEEGAILTGGSLLFTNGGRKVLRLLLSNGQIDNVFDGTADVLDDATNTELMWYEPLNQLWVAAAGTFKVYTFNIGQGIDIFHDEIISSVAQKVGLKPEELDFNSLAAEPGLKSYVLADRQSASKLLSPLLQTLQIDVHESDNKVIFVKRGLKTSSLSLDEDDFMRTSEREEEAFLRFRLTETELPRRFEVEHDDPENQYQQNIQSDERSTSAVSSRGTRAQNFPGAMTADSARRRAQTLLYSAWAEQERFSTRLAWNDINVDPTDIVTVTLNSGDVLRLRVTQADIGADLTIDLQAVVETTDLLTFTNVPGATGDGNQVYFPSVVNSSSTFVFDTPLIRDKDASSTGQSTAYWAGSGEPVWRGVVLYRQEGDTIITEVGKQLDPVPFGSVITAPPDISTVHVFEDTSLVVQVVRGADLFESVSDLDMFNGANALLVVKANGEVEILQFASVEVDNSDPDRLTLSRLLRGRRGTETMANGLAAGDQVFLLRSSNSVNAFSRSIATLNTPTTYRGVTIGQIFEAAAPFSHTDTGRDLKPYAPVFIEVAQPGGADTDLNFTWVRRTRIGGEDDFADTVTDVPLSEDTESYDLVIYSDNTYTTELRTINVNSEAATYTSAQITADTPGSTIYFRVYQRSAQVGRGFASNQSTPRNL
jgi:hypothetical protein